VEEGIYPLAGKKRGVPVEEILKLFNLHSVRCLVIGRLEGIACTLCWPTEDSAVGRHKMAACLGQSAGGLIKAKTKVVKPDPSS